MKRFLRVSGTAFRCGPHRTVYTVTEVRHYYAVTPGKVPRGQFDMHTVPWLSDVCCKVLSMTLQLVIGSGAAALEGHLHHA